MHLHYHYPWLLVQLIEIYIYVWFVCMYKYDLFYTFWRFWIQIELAPSPLVTSSPAQPLSWLPSWSSIDRAAASFHSHHLTQIAANLFSIWALIYIEVQWLQWAYIQNTFYVYFLYCQGFHSSSNSFLFFIFIFRRLFQLLTI